MVDAALIQQCADPGLKPAIIERFIREAGSPDPLKVTVRSGSRVVLVPQPKTPDEAMEIIRQHVGRNVVLVGHTQYPAGLGAIDRSDLKADLVSPCENLRMGTALFAKVYRIVVRWYGSPRDEAVEDAILAWRTGTFDGIGVFSAPDPGEEPAKSVPTDAVDDAQAASTLESSRPEAPRNADDPNTAGIRVDLSGTGARKL